MKRGHADVWMALGIGVAMTTVITVLEFRDRRPVVVAVPPTVRGDAWRAIVTFGEGGARGQYR